MIRLEYYGHSCFVIEAEGYRIALDPYDAHVQGYAPLHVEADKVLCSHGHGDHAYTAAVALKEGGTDPFIVTEIESFHDDKEGGLRGPNTIRIFAYGGLRVAHFGDIGCRPTDAQMAQLKGLDAALIPVGGFYTLDASQEKALMDELDPKTIIPMHYRRGAQGFDVLADISEFTSMYADAQYTGKSELEIGGALPKVAVMEAR